LLVHLDQAGVSACEEKELAQCRYFKYY